MSRGNGRKTVNDLKENADSYHQLVSSVGGAMSQWPRRTLTWICRDQRVNSVDPNVAETLLDREVNDLGRLVSFAANEADIEASTLDLKRRALDSHETDRILNELRVKYQKHWKGDMTECPFEENGLDKACWRCPVAGDTLESLTGEL